METKITNHSAIKEIANAIINGETIAFKTDTVWGLSCIATNKNACKNLINIKGRENKPLIVLLQNKKQLNKYVKNISPKLQKIIDAFWPGPLTIIFETKFDFCEEITCGKPTIAIRIPSHNLTQNILTAVNAPIVSTSANISGQPILTSSKEIVDIFNGKIPYIVEDEENSSQTVSSTIISCIDEQICILREGSITKQQIENVILSKTN